MTWPLDATAWWEAGRTQQVQLAGTQEVKGKHRAEAAVIA